MRLTYPRGTWLQWGVEWIGGERWNERYTRDLQDTTQLCHITWQENKCSCYFLIFITLSSTRTVCWWLWNQGIMIIVPSTHFYARLFPATFFFVVVDDFCFIYFQRNWSLYSSNTLTHINTPSISALLTAVVCMSKQKCIQYIS